MIFFLSGMLLMGYVLAAIFFARFWRDSRDRLFLFFAVGFALLAIHRASLAAAGYLPFPAPYTYVLRLIAYMVMLAAIVDKNRR